MKDKFPLIKLGLLVSAGLLSACGAVPSSGPSTGKVAYLKNQQASTKVPEVSVVEVDELVTSALYKQKIEQSLSKLGDGSGVSGGVNIGDILDITIWEAPPALLFGGALSSAGSGSAQFTKLPEQMVNTHGMISVPFIGDIAVAGKTPFQIQEGIQGRLKKMANQPQVMVRLSQNNAANVSVIRAGNSVRLPLTPAKERVLDAVAAVGGSTANVQDTNVQLTRGNQVKTVALEDLVANPRQNVMLQKDDIVTLITNPYTFTSMGAVGKTQEIGFSAKGLSLAEAIGRMGGLHDRRSDARGVFVFRYQQVDDLPEDEKGHWLAKGYSYDAEIPVVYRLNLADANSLFWMQRFPVKNKDVVYVSNAPLAEVQKFLQFIFSPVVNGISDIDSLSD